MRNDQERMIEEAIEDIKTALNKIISACKYVDPYWPFMPKRALSLDLSPLQEREWTIEVFWGVEKRTKDWIPQDGVPRLVKRINLKTGRRLKTAKTYLLTSYYGSFQARVVGLRGDYTPERVAAFLQLLEGFAAEIRKHGEEARKRAKEALETPEAKEVRRRALERALEDMDR